MQNYSKKSKNVEQMFTKIADKYDTMNHILSFGLDFLWRKKLIQLISRLRPNKIIDLATGSGDVAFGLSENDNNSDITALDFCDKLLVIAKKKQSKNNKYQNINFINGNCMQLKLEANTYDVASVSFGIRNFEDRYQGFTEILKVLKPNASLFILEFTQPLKLFKPFYFFYLKLIIPIIARFFTNDKNAYKYLGGTIEDFPNKDDLKNELINAGFRDVKYYSVTFSIVSIHHAIK